MTYEEVKKLPIGTILIDSEFGLVKVLKQLDDLEAVEVFVINRGRNSLTWAEDLTTPTSLLLELI